MDKNILKPCPFCGAPPINLRTEILHNGRMVNFHGNFAKLTCPACCVTMEAVSQPERYEHVEGDLYRKIPHKYAEEVLTEKWNSRTGRDSDG